MRFDAVAKIFNAYKSAAISQTLHRNDIMYNSGPKWYDVVGENGIDCILSGLLLTNLTKVTRVLDLPCGHGRVGRHLAAAFPSAEIFFCDIDREAVDFCATEFNGIPLYSEVDLTKANIPSNIDVIWIGSLFTHLDKRTMATWLEYLSRHLSNNGIIVATFHGYFTAINPPADARINFHELRLEFDASGYAFHAYAASDPARGIDYGFSVAKPSTILDVADAIPGTRVASYTERGWGRNHDVLVLCKDDRLRPFGSP